jgi:hypothetical protein
VGECALWARLTGPSIAGQVAAAVGLVEAPKNYWEATSVAKEAMAIKYSNKTSLSITKFLEPPFAGKHPNQRAPGGSLRSEGANAAVQAERSTPIKILRSLEHSYALIMNAVISSNFIIGVHLHGKRYTRIVRFLNHHQ